jgi:hypothetical protein
MLSGKSGEPAHEILQHLDSVELTNLQEKKAGQFRLLLYMPDKFI